MRPVGCSVRLPCDLHVMFEVKLEDAAEEGGVTTSYTCADDK